LPKYPSFYQQRKKKKGGEKKSVKNTVVSPKIIGCLAGGRANPSMMGLITAAVLNIRGKNMTLFAWKYVLSFSLPFIKDVFSLYRLGPMKARLSTLNKWDIISIKGTNYPPRIHIARKIIKYKERERKNMYENHGIMTTNEQKQKKKDKGGKNKIKTIKGGRIAVSL
jgi:hypothetical protein